MKINKYSMSFTTGGLFHQNSTNMVKLYFDLGTWVKVRKEVIEQNLLQARTQRTLKMITSEICSRLKLLHQEELQVLIEDTPHDQAYILWLAVCRRYLFIYEFAVEVLREKFLSLQFELQKCNFSSLIILEILK